MNRSLILALVSLTVGCNTPMDLGGNIKPASVVTGGTCTQDADCVTGDHCSSQKCVADDTDGGSGGAGTTCTANNQCTSGICGSAGSGHCCTAACAAGADAGCFATDCDDTGACVYPAASGCPCGKDTDCKDTRICVDGACVFPGTGVCFIQGQFISSGNYNPANSCQDCEPTLNDIDWTTNFKVSSTVQAEADAGGTNGPRPFSSTVGGRLDSLLVAELIAHRITVVQGGAIQSSFSVNSLYPEMVASMDLNGDGLNDVIVAGPNGATTLDIALFLNDGDGGFTPGATYSAPQDASVDGGGGTFSSYFFEHMETGDFNGDGSEILSVGLSTTVYGSPLYLTYTQLQLYGLDGDGGLAAPVTVTQQLSQQGSQRLGDFNEDGKTDILYWAPNAATSTDGGSGPFSPLTLLLSNGGGQFSDTSEPIPGAPTYLDGTVVGDFNGDGHLDVTFVNADGTISVELGDGQGGFGSAKNSGPGSSSNAQPFLVAGDFNGDGHLDLARLDSLCQTTCEQTLTIWLGVGDGTFLSPGPAVPLSSFPAIWGVSYSNLGFAGPMAALDTGNGRPDLALTYGYVVDTSTTGYATAVFHNGCH